MSWTIWIAHRVPSANARYVNGNTRWSRAKYRKVREDWKMLAVSAMNEHSIPKAKVRRRVSIARIYSGREQEMDYDNLVGGCKAVVDGFSAAGIMTDDSPTYVTLAYEQRRDAERSGIEVVIADIDTAEPRPINAMPMRIDGVKRAVLDQAYRARAGLIGAMAGCTCGFPIVPYGTSSQHDERCNAHKWLVAGGLDAVRIAKAP